MGIAPFRVSKDSYPESKNRIINNNVINNVTVNNSAPNPNPANYRIINDLQINNNLVVEILYPDCSNYEGRKILVFKGISLEKLLKQKLIDPHFSENKKYKSPFARFEPTKKGWEAALKLAYLI